MKKRSLLLQGKLFCYSIARRKLGHCDAEALACDFAAICCDLSEIKPIWKDNVVRVQKGNVAEFAAVQSGYFEDRIRRMMPEAKSKHEAALLAQLKS